MICPICHHENKKEEGVHQPGDCNQCNCGESEIIRSVYGYDGVSFEIIPLRVNRNSFYTRKGLPRRVFKTR